MTYPGNKSIVCHLNKNRFEKVNANKGDMRIDETKLSWPPNAVNFQLPVTDRLAIPHIVPAPSSWSVHLETIEDHIAGQHREIQSLKLTWRLNKNSPLRSKS